ncbi:hypothetical protein BGX31_008747 [Mortierella sp. GBA43]|nr:hypothetical protein BGX31_008747 [Mortierella sp. GBA43]
MVNAPEQESSSSAMPTSSDPLEANPIASLPQVYRGFFYSNPELLDSDQSSSDMDMETTEMMDMDMDMMDMEMDEDMPAIQARALAEIRQASTNRVQVVPLIADRQRKLETIDTINLMNISQQQQQQNGGGAHANGSSSGANSSTANSVQQSPGDSPLNSANGNSNEQGSGTSDPNQHTPQRRKKASRAI